MIVSKASLQLQWNGSSERWPTELTLIKMQETLQLKIWKDRWTLILCDNAAGHMIKSAVVYRGKNPCACKTKKFSACVLVTSSESMGRWSAILFIGWFQCFILEVKKYSKEGELEFKVLLITVPVPGHLDCLLWKWKCWSYILTSKYLTASAPWPGHHLLYESHIQGSLGGAAV